MIILLKRFKKKTLITLIIILTLSLTVPVTVNASLVGDEEISSKSAIVIDSDSGLVIYELNADAQRVPASMTKLIAAYVVFDAIRDGYASFETMVYINEEKSLFSYNREFSNVPMPAGSYYSIGELLDVVLVRSACAATVAMVEAVYGSEQVAVDKMNEKMASLGIEAMFYDSWGRSPNNRISARGMAMAARAVLQDHPEILEITSKSSVMFDDISYSSTNFLFGTYEGIDGLKTGFTNPAGWCFTATALQNGRRIISVTMGSEMGLRFADTRVLLDYGFTNVNTVIADHIRGVVFTSDLDKALESPLVPIIAYDVEDAGYYTLRFLALILNEPW